MWKKKAAEAIRFTIGVLHDVAYYLETGKKEQLGFSAKTQEQKNKPRVGNLDIDFEGNASEHEKILKNLFESKEAPSGLETLALWESAPPCDREDMRGYWQEPYRKDVSEEQLQMEEMWDFCEDHEEMEALADEMEEYQEPSDEHVFIPAQKRNWTLEARSKINPLPAEQRGENYGGVMPEEGKHGPVQTLAQFREKVLKSEEQAREENSQRRAHIVESIFGDSNTPSDRM